MRIIAGEFRSRKILSVPGLSVRPTPDRLRESLFSILAPEIEGTAFVDAYAGSGSVGLEALSRGARRAIFIEKNADALAVLRKNLETLGLQQRASVVKASAPSALATLHADIVFLDPPFTEPAEFEKALQALAPGQAPLVIVQHPPKLALAETYGSLAHKRTVRQGDNCLRFYRLTAAGS
jgi:16S rRNA (guanine966-N2)-methyltransferase